MIINKIFIIWLINYELLKYLQKNINIFNTFNIHKRVSIKSKSKTYVFGLYIHFGIRAKIIYFSLCLKGAKD